MTTTEDILERLVIDEEHYGNREAIELMEQGIRYLSKEDNEQNKKAFSYFMKAAKTGDAQAQYYVGYFYERGIGVEQDIEQAVHYYTRSANSGWGTAVNVLSHMKKYKPNIHTEMHS